MPCPTLLITFVAVLGASITTYKSKIECHSQLTEVAPCCPASSWTTDPRS